MTAVRRAPAHRPARRAAALGAMLAAAVAIALLALSLAAPAGAARSADPVTPEQAATQMCQQAQTAMGPMFSTLVGTMAQCEARAFAVVKDAVEKCKTAADNAACVNTAVQTGIMSLASGGSGGVSGGVGDAMLAQALSQACSQLQAKMGAQRFAKEYGSSAGCRDKLRPEIEKIVSAAQAACTGNANPTACIAQQAASAEAALVAKLGGGPSADALASEIATEVCARLQVELGDQFAAKYGTAAACTTQIAAKAAPLAAAATTKCRSAADQEACITAEINASIDQLSTQLGAGPTLDDITDNVAAQACARLKTELGAGFARTYGTVAACTAKVKAAAAPFAAAALARCAKATGAAQAACIRTAVTESTAELQAAIGAGPTVDELGDQVAAQACARIKAELGPRFAAKYPTAAACTAAVKAAAAPDLKAALATCAKSTNTAACSETAAREIAARLTTQLAGPTVDDVTAEVVEQACARIKASLDAQEFAARFRDARGCAAAILKDAAAAATRAVAACKAAPDREACIERSVSTLTATLTAQFAGKTLDATDLAARLATQACAAVQAKVSAGDFAKAFGGSTGCRQRVAGDATAAAAATVQRCSSVAPGGQPACAEAQLRSAATAIEARLRATIKVLPSQIDTVTSQLLDQLCQAAAAELGRLLDGGIPGCKARAAGDARAAAYAAFDECNGAEACVRQSLASRAETLRKRLFPVGADPSLDMLTFEIARNACAPVYDAVVNKQRRESDWVRVFRSDRLSACTTWSDAIARTKASAVQKSCSSVRPADRRKTCFESQVPAASKSLEPTLVQATAALKKAAPAKR